MLQAAAVLGIEPQLDVLRAMLANDSASSAAVLRMTRDGNRPGTGHTRMTLERTAFEAAMADAERAGLLGPDQSGELTFTSRLVRDIVYDATPADVRRSLHHAAAGAVESLSPDAALLGHH